MHRFIATEKAHQSVLCRVLGVSRAGFYAAERRPRSERQFDDERILVAICKIHADSRETYGSPRVHAMLARRGVHLGRKRVARLMRREGLSGLIKRRRGKTTVRVPGVATRPDLVRREWNPTERNRLWVADITYCRTWEGWLYLAAVLDCHSRRVVGWSIRQGLEAELVTEAIEMAVTRRRPAEGLVHHSDRGSQPGLNRSSQQCVGDRTVGMASDGCACAVPQRLVWGDAAVVAEARPEGGPERRQPARVPVVPPSWCALLASAVHGPWLGPASSS